MADLATDLASIIARLVDARLEARLAELRPAQDWIDQSASPLGRRAHLAAVRRGELPGRRVGKKVLVRRADLDAYIAERGAVRVEPEAARREDGDDLAASISRAAARRGRGAR